MIRQASGRIATDAPKAMPYPTHAQGRSHSRGASADRLRRPDSTQPAAPPATMHVQATMARPVPNTSRIASESVESVAAPRGMGVMVGYSVVTMAGRTKRLSIVRNPGR
jgi:hypothetical protein